MKRRLNAKATSSTSALKSKSTSTSKRKPAPSKSAKSSPGNKNNKKQDDNAGKRVRVLARIRALAGGEGVELRSDRQGRGVGGAARQVVRILRQVPGLPWHRVVGSGGAIKLGGENAAEQRFRLRMEGVTFRGARVDMKRHEFQFKSLRR